MQIATPGLFAAQKAIELAPLIGRHIQVTVSLGPSATLTASSVCVMAFGGL
jgi:hypothetical protein